MDRILRQRKSRRPKIVFLLSVVNFRSPAVANPMTMTMTTATSLPSNTDTNPPQPAIPSRNPQPSLAKPTTPNPNENAPETRLILKITANTESVNIALLHRRCFELMLFTDPKLKLSTINPTKPIISNLEEFPTNDEYLTAFKITNRSTNKIHLAFTILSTLSLAQIKRKNPNLIEHLKINNMSLQASLTGSDNETTIGAIFGINPEKTSRENLHTDLRLALQRIDPATLDTEIIQMDTSNNHLNPNIPPFQIETRKINKQHDQLEFTTKAFHIICDRRHSHALLHLFETGTNDGTLAGMGKFLSFKFSNTSICKAIKWHNDIMINLRVFQITELPHDLMDQPIRSTSTTTWRQKLVSDGKLTNVYRAKENHRFIATTTNLEQSMSYFKSTFQPLFSTVHHLPTTPAASIVQKPIKPILHDTPQNSGWDFLDDDASLLTESTYFHTKPRTKPTMVQFVYSTDFPHPPKPAHSTQESQQAKETLSKSSDTLTTITQDDLHSLRDQLRSEFRNELTTFRNEQANHHLEQLHNQTHHTDAMNAIIAANQENQARIHELVSAFQTFQTTIFNTLGLPSDHHPEAAAHTATEGRKRDMSSTPVHRNTTESDSDSSSPFLTPLSKSNNSKKRLKGFNANHLYYPEHDVTANLSNAFDAIMSSDDLDTDQPATSQAGPHAE